MNALRILLLVLAVGVLGLVARRSLPTRVPAPPSVVALEEAMRAPASPLPRLTPSPPRTAVPPAAVTPEARIAEVPEFARFYDALKADFPRAYADLLERIGRPGEAAGADVVIWDALRDLEQSQGILAAQAGAGALDRFFDARSAMLEGLAPLNARQCVDFLYGVTDASVGDFTAAHRGLVATLADRTLEAIADGRSRHDERPAPTPADLDALSAALAARGLTPGEVGLLIDGTTPDPPVPDARVCDIGRIYLDVLHGLPEEARHRIYGLAAELLARS